MKKMMLILVMLLIAATAYNQTSRRSANTKATAKKNVARSTQVRSTNKPGNSHQDRSTTTRRSEQRNTSRATQSSRDNKQPANARSSNRSSQSNRSATKPSTRRSSTTTAATSRSNTNRSSQRSTTTAPRRSSSTSTTRRSTTTAPHRSSSHSTTRRSATTSNRTVVEYRSPRNHRSRHVVHHHYHTPPRSIEYRRVHHVYRRPVKIEYYWTPAMHRHFIDIYPMVPHWSYYNGYRIQMISAYDAMYYRGDVMTVYGRVTDVYYSRATDEFFLYFGPFYPYQDFTVVMPGYLARRYSRHPERYFTNRHLAVTGLITTFEGEPEIVVKKNFQLRLY